MHKFEKKKYIQFISMNLNGTTRYWKLGSTNSHGKGYFYVYNYSYLYIQVLGDADCFSSKSKRLVEKMVDHSFPKFLFYHMVEDIMS